MVRLSEMRALVEACEAAKWALKNYYAIGDERTKAIIDAYNAIAGKPTEYVLDADHDLAAAEQLSVMVGDGKSREDRLLLEAHGLIRQRAAAKIAGALLEKTLEATKMEDDPCDASEQVAGVAE